MPNHITNRLQFIGNEKEVNKLLTAIKSENEEGEEMQIDFNKILPMPKSLEITSGSLGDHAHQLLFGSKQKFFQLPIEELQRRFKELDKDRQLEAVNLAIEYQDNINKYGSSTWYDWSVNNWGTKWNAYDQNDERNTHDTIHFKTAWSAPIELIRKLSNLFPKVEILMTYADEDTGSNTGIVRMKDGAIIDLNQPESQSKEGYEIAFELNPGSKEYYKFNGSTYEYNEED